MMRLSTSTTLLLPRRYTRQSARREDGVCNKWGQAHDIKNLFISDSSQFTTGAAANPTLTIVALAIRQADYIADQIAKQDI
jgi:choline dehydrogenase-like flavoprotein